MSELPAVTGREAIKAFQTVGFEVARVEGSHHILKKPGHPFNLSIPVHGNKPLKRGTVRRLIRDAGLSVKQFVEVLNK